MSHNKELTGRRYRRLYRGMALYIVVADGPDGEALEIFVSMPGQDDELKNALTAAGADLATRLFSLARKYGAPLSECIEQMQRASRSEFDLPGILADVLQNKEGERDEDRAFCLGLGVCFVRANPAEDGRAARK